MFAADQHISWQLRPRRAFCNDLLNSFLPLCSNHRHRTLDPVATSPTSWQGSANAEQAITTGISFLDFDSTKYTGIRRELFFITRQEDLPEDVDVVCNIHSLRGWRTVVGVGCCVRCEMVRASSFWSVMRRGPDLPALGN